MQLMEGEPLLGKLKIHKSNFFIEMSVAVICNHINLAIDNTCFCKISKSYRNSPAPALAFLVPWLPQLPAAPSLLLIPFTWAAVASAQIPQWGTRTFKSSALDQPRSAGSLDSLRCISGRAGGRGVGGRKAVQSRQDSPCNRSCLAQPQYENHFKCLWRKVVQIFNKIRHRCHTPCWKKHDVVWIVSHCC